MSCEIEKFLKKPSLYNIDLGVILRDTRSANKLDRFSSCADLSSPGGGEDGERRTPDLSRGPAGS